MVLELVYNMVPDKNDASWIWIPQGVDKGKWAGSDACFAFECLDKFYETEVSSLLLQTFGVTGNVIALALLTVVLFWDFVAKHWNAKTKGLVLTFIMKRSCEHGFWWEFACQQG
ncbi:hypothetical protein CKAN_00869300 [Cinnamomum micranthum f. kanehirae]|uniref:Uncharacterized protein n=1 Tax=Cinnamomum micranthum f. kanehirae TaxID=337451 RepID=A0A3S3N3H2_9MAGN|nr:hypothetical protein CKAN_00869300 [Cinnamomum micranthum f. kanehirae]